MDLGLTDTVWIVTGGTRGLGFATAKVLVAEGARVVVASRNEERVAAAVAELGGRDRALGIAADLAEPGADGRLIAAAQARWDRLDGALLSVGGPPASEARSTTDEAWRTAFESVFLGPLRMARSVVAAGGRSLAFVLSTSVRAPIPGLAISNGLRPGLAMVAKSLADELGPEGVRVNTLLPGRIDTDRIRELESGRGGAAARKQLEAAIPLRRYGQPEEFGRVAAFVLSPAASYLTGLALAVDGGATRAL